MCFIDLPQTVSLRGTYWKRKVTLNATQTKFISSVFFFRKTRGTSFSSMWSLDVSDGSRKIPSPEYRTTHLHVPRHHDRPNFNPIFEPTTTEGVRFRWANFEPKYFIHWLAKIWADFEMLCRFPPLHSFSNAARGRGCRRRRACIACRRKKRRRGINWWS